MDLAREKAFSAILLALSFQILRRIFVLDFEVRFFGTAIINNTLLIKNEREDFSILLFLDCEKNRKSWRLYIFIREEIFYVICISPPHLRKLNQQQIALIFVYDPIYVASFSWKSSYKL